MGAVLRQLLRSDLQHRLLAFREETTLRLRRQAIDVGVTLGLLAGGALAALLTLLIGLAALFVAVAERNGPLIALGVVGGVTAIMAALLFALAAARSKTARPALAVASRPSAPRLALSTNASAAEVLARDVAARAAATGTGVVEGATDIVRHGSRPAVLGVIALVAVVGVLLGRRA
jgi:hypothetical protein